MNINYEHINPTFHEHEGYTFLEWEGEFYKGCKRCGGSGHYQFNGEHDRCYECGNTSAKLGAQLSSREAAEKWCHGKAQAQARCDAKRNAEAQARVDAMLAKQADLKASDPDVYEFLMAVDDNEGDFSEDGSVWVENRNRERSTFVLDMCHLLTWPANHARLFTPNMIAAIRRTMEQRVAKAAEAALTPAPAGRVTVTGTIASTKMVDSEYGTAYKILVKDDRGFKVWASLPKAQADEAITEFESQNDPSVVGYGVWFMGSTNEPEMFKGVKGKRITFTATLEPSKDDQAFAFGSRPTKGAWL